MPPVSSQRKRARSSSGALKWTSAPRSALHRVVVAHGRQHRFGGEQQVAVLPEAHVGRLAVDRQVLAQVLEKVDPEQADADVLGGGELLPEAARRLRRRGVLVGRVAFDHQHRPVEPGLAGEEQRGGAAGDTAADDHYVVSSVHGSMIPRHEMARCSMRRPSMVRRNRSSLARVRAAASCIAISPMHAKRLFPMVALILVQPAAGATPTGERCARRARPCAAPADYRDPRRLFTRALPDDDGGHP